MRVDVLQSTRAFSCCRAITSEGEPRRRRVGGGYRVVVWRWMTVQELSETRIFEAE
jgi:hypothetical protein